MVKKYVIKKGDKYYPSDEMKKIALVDEKIYSEADKNPIKFWEKLAEDGINWEKKWDKAYVEKLPYFTGIKSISLNAPPEKGWLGDSTITIIAQVYAEK